MKKHRYLWLTQVVFGIALFSSAQVTITGKTKDAKQFLPFVTIQLLGPDSNQVQRTITGENGEFTFSNLAPGYYRITSTAIGYVQFVSEPIRVTRENLIYPDIVFEREMTGLTGITVKARKPVFEQQPGKLVINVQNSISSAGNSVLEILQKSPGVSVDKQSNNINLNGKPGARVMINGKLVQLPMDAVVQMLEGMNGSNVEKIELISNPSSKYDAEGSAGIIHIVMRGDAGLGTNGTVGLVYGYHWAETPGMNFSLSHRSRRIAFFIDYSVLRNHNLHRQQMNNTTTVGRFHQTLDDTSDRENVTTQQNLSAGIEWRHSENTWLNATFTAYRRDWSLDALTRDIHHVAFDSTVSTNSKVHELNTWQSATAGIGCHTKINSKSEVTLNFDYLYYHNENPSGYDNETFYEQQNNYNHSKIDLTKATPINFFVVKADYQFNISSSLVVEAGAKSVSSSLHNNVFVRRFENNKWNNDSAFISNSALNEQVAASYVSMKWQAGKRLLINAGLRYEYTHTTVGTGEQKYFVNRNYGYLFPAFLLKRNLGKCEDIELSYSRRITRPTYNDMAPFVFFWGPNAFSSGNISILPAIADAVKVVYHLQQWISSIQFNHSKNEICFLQPELDSQSNHLIYRSQNLRYLNTIGLTNTWSSAVTPWWDIQANVTVQYQGSKTTAETKNTAIHLYSYNGNVVNVLKLPASLTAEISALYQSRVLVGISEYLPSWSLNAGVQKKLSAKTTLRLAMDDIFNTSFWRIRTYLPQNRLDNYFMYNFHNQFIRMTFTWKFGNNKLQSIKVKTASEEERGRVNY